ncbi:MAG: hypothetical protein IJ087_00320 [Eggerthellaceae bacterium]|nr:hypothetical protein [Eggerthellaceae bacterium]
MSSMVEATAKALYAQLIRLDKLAMDDMDKVKAECDRATAVNSTAHSIIGLGDLYIRSQMLQMNRPDRAFEGGILFDGPRRDDLKAPDFGGRTKLNEHGEFETDDGLDAMTGSVEENTSSASKREPDHDWGSR